jgi:hypothetical protein
MLLQVTAMFPSHPYASVATGWPKFPVTNPIAERFTRFRGEGLKGDV